MTYFSGSTSNTTNPAKDFMELVLHSNLLTVGFTYVEQVVSGANTSRVYKSASASNGVGDWYLVAIRTSDTDTQVNFGAGEDYDAVGHLLKKWCPTFVSGGQTLPADRTHYTTAGIAPHQSGGLNYPLPFVTTAHPYLLSLNTKRVVMSTNAGGVRRLIYAGLYDSLLFGVANSFPLCVWESEYYNGSTFVSYSREPGTGTSVGTSSGTGTFTTGPGPFNVVAPISSMDGYQNLPTITRFYLPGSQSKTAVRGMPIGVYAASINIFGYGDTVNITWDQTALTTTCFTPAMTTPQFSLLVDQAL